MTTEELVNENVTDNLNSQIEAITAHSKELEQMLVQTLEVMAKMEPSQRFNPVPILQKGDTIRRDLRQQTDQTRQHVDQMEQLVRTSALITTSLEINQVLEDVIDTVITLTGAERAYLMLVNSHDDDVSVTVRAARNAKHENISSEDVVFSRGVIKSALEESKPIVSVDAGEDERFQAMQSVMNHSLRSIMVIPMMLQGEALGVVYLDNHLAKAVFHQKSVPLLSAFANQAAIAIENARLFERVQENLIRTKREVKRLRIQLDQNKVESQAMEITGSDYFKELADMAKSLRERTANK